MFNYLEFIPNNKTKVAIVLKSFAAFISFTALFDNTKNLCILEY